MVDSLNPFEARVQDFHASATNTFASMLVQLGERYERQAIGVITTELATKNEACDTIV